MIGVLGHQHHSEGRRVIDIEVGAAITAGLVAGAIMEGPVYLQKALGLPVKQNIFRTWGRLFGQRGTSGYVVGMLFHEVLAAVIAVGYAAFFRLLGVDGNLWLWGAVAALIHYAVAAVVVAALPSVDPETDEVGRQGVGYKNYGGLDMATFLMGHLSFGLLTGIFYGIFHSGTGLAF
jgi:hypothetical protein